MDTDSVLNILVYNILYIIYSIFLVIQRLKDTKILWVEDKMPYIFKCLEADVLGGLLGSKKWVQANFTWPKFSEVRKSDWVNSPPTVQMYF